TQVLSPREAFLVEGTPESFAEGILSALDPSEARAERVLHAKNLYESAYGAGAYSSRLKKALQHVHV
ncbi:MAG: hypothetical protein HY548_06015, partial [Elusimicrobia bacterium]|nr:hypothetical protein [Elusimicrobiota bacterium]